MRTSVVALAVWLTATGAAFAQSLPTAPPETVGMAPDRLARVTAAMKGVTAKDMSANHGQPMHPGAEKYFKEAGLLK